MTTSPLPDTATPAPEQLVPEAMINYLAKWLRGQQQVLSTLLATVNAVSEEIQTSVKRLQEECEKVSRLTPPRPPRPAPTPKPKATTSAAAKASRPRATASKTTSVAGKTRRR